MYILGLNAYHADSSAALLKDGLLIGAIEEERFKRIKHWAGFPAEAIKFCLNEAGITIDDVDHIAIGRDPYAKLGKKVVFTLSHPRIGWSALQNRLKNTSQVLSLADEFSNLFPGSDKATIKSRIHNVEHHRAHLASAFFASSFPDASLLSIDGSGDFSTTMLGSGHGNQISVINSIDFPHSLGIFYSSFTQYLGFPHYGDEYKIMGLAPYGNPLYVDKLKDIVHCLQNGLFRLDLSWFNVTHGNIISYGEDHIPKVETLYTRKFIDAFGPARQAGEELNQYHRDVAASVQQYTEQIIFHLLNGLYEKTKIPVVCLAGGVAQNSVANGKITRNTPFREVYIPSAGHDAGISMGAAFYVYNQLLRQPRMPVIRNAYTGSSYSSASIKGLLDSEGIRYTEYTDEELYDVVSGAIANGGVIGWFNGRAEFGPRALGGRSILADPRRHDAKNLLNEKVKRRESFRPFAPSILKEEVGNYFEVNDDVPFMEKVFPVKKNKQEIIPAVTHVDGSGRLQTVEENVNSRYYKLIQAFYKKTGVPVLLNTSFNENEPIVNHPMEALNCFRRTQMDLLVLENIVINRQQLNGSGSTEKTIE
jgi:carbamoyltransferase